MYIYMCIYTCTLSCNKVVLRKDGVEVHPNAQLLPTPRNRNSRGPFAKGAAAAGLALPAVAIAIATAKAIAIAPPIALPDAADAGPPPVQAKATAAA